MKRFAILPAILVMAGCTQTLPAAPATAPAASSSAAPGRCHTGDLSLSIGGGGAAAGTRRDFLIFTDKSGGECTLYGYPGVSWITGDQGSQVNEPFQRIDADRRTKLELEPGSKADAILTTHTAENYPAATCKPVPVRGLRVYPPDETAAIFVPRSQTACSVRGVNLAEVDPLGAGASSLAARGVRGASQRGSRLANP